MHFILGCYIPGVLFRAKRGDGGGAWRCAIDGWRWCFVLGANFILGYDLFCMHFILGCFISGVIFRAKTNDGGGHGDVLAHTGTIGILSPSTTLVIFFGLKSTRGGIFQRNISLKYLLKYFLALRGLNIS